MKIITTTIAFVLIAGSIYSERIWKNESGVEIAAEYISHEADTVTIKRASDNREFTIPITLLCEEDQDYVYDNVPRVNQLKSIKEPKEEHFMELRDLTLEGNPYTIEVLNILAERLYEDIDYKENRDRVIENLRIMRKVFSPIGEAAGRGDEVAFDALIKATGYSKIRSFTADAFGLGAGAGNEKCLEVLLNHKRHGILRSSTVFALKYAAENNEPLAIEFLADILMNEKAKALWHGASQGLIRAANEGNPIAIKALDEYAKRE